MKIWPFLLIFLSVANADEEALCPTVIVKSSEKISFTDTEKRLVCGDNEVTAYKIIPPYQASFSMTGFLQARGYLSSKFDFEEDKLIVNVGEKSTVKEIKSLSNSTTFNEILEKEIYRIYRGNVITPSLLNNIESSSRSELRKNGYACAKVASQVDPTTGVITLTSTGLKLFYFTPFEREEVEGIYPEALERFYPFRNGDLFNETQLQLTEKRFLRAGVVQGTYFSEACNDEEQTFSFSQKFIVGPPRTIRFGVGASTEVGPMVRVKWSNQRYGNMASLREANLQASFKTQSINFLMEDFLWRERPRRSLVTEFEISRTDLSDYEEVVTSLKPHMKWTHDKYSRKLTWSIGPTILAGRYKTNSESKSQTFTTGAIEGGIQTMTHSYEVFDFHPREGHLFNFKFDYRDPTFGFIEPLLKLDTTLLKLFKLGSWGRGSAVFGVRANAGVTWISDDFDIEKLPPSVKFYGGGSDDIRGFKLNALPENEGVGSLTKLGLKLELRKTHFFDSSLEAFGFVDGAYFGQKSWEVDSKLWYSPGVGIRWLSPIGIVQTYWARAYAINPTTTRGDNFYFGLGGVF